MQRRISQVMLMGMLLLAAVCIPAAEARAGDYVEYMGTIHVGRPLGRVVADPTRPKVYGITGDGDVVFVDRTTMAVEKVSSTGRCLRDIDVDPAGDYLTVLDNITGEYWNQPPSVYILTYDLETQSPSAIVMAQAPMYQMALGRPNRFLGVGLNQWVSAYQVDATTGARLSSCGAGYYGSTEWGTQTFAATSDGTRLFRTELGISLIELKAFDTSTDTITAVASRGVGSYAAEPVFINSSDSSLYVGDIRVDPANIGVTLRMYPENIYAATGDDKLAFGVGGVYDPVWGTPLEDMPVHFSMMTIGEGDRYLYAFDPGSQQLHVMYVVPEPAALSLLALGGLVLLGRRRGCVPQNKQRRLAPARFG